MFYNGISFVENKVFTKGYKEIPRRKNKNKRIQKKWIKEFGFRSIPLPDPNLYFIDGKFYGHPTTIKKVFKLINK